MKLLKLTKAIYRIVTEIDGRKLTKNLRSNLSVRQRYLTVTNQCCRFTSKKKFKEQNFREMRCADYGCAENMSEPKCDGKPLPLAWREFIRFCKDLRYGEIERLSIQNGLPVLAEMTKKKVKFTGES